MRRLLRTSEAIESLMRAMMWIGGILLILMMLAIATEIVTRRLRLEIPGLGPVRLMELQWHFHSMLFMLTLGYGYVSNVHVRIDMLAAQVGMRIRAWTELIGIIVFLLPFAIALTWWGASYALQSWRFAEVSDMAGGLGSRWAIKAIIPVGSILLILAGISNFLRLVVFLFGDDELHLYAKPAMITDEIVLIEAPSINRNR